jgi:hypothetical protein
MAPVFVGGALSFKGETLNKADVKNNTKKKKHKAKHKILQQEKQQQQQQQQVTNVSEPSSSSSRHRTSRIAMLDESSGNYPIAGHGYQNNDYDDSNHNATATNDDIDEDDDNDDDGLTEAERKAAQKQRQRELLVLSQVAQKTHRERIEEFNQKLSQLTEHNDIPRVSVCVYMAKMKCFLSITSFLPPKICLFLCPNVLFIFCSHQLYIFCHVLFRKHKNNCRSVPPEMDDKGREYGTTECASCTQANL